MKLNVKVYYNAKEDRYLATILKGGEIEVVRRPEYAKYWNRKSVNRMGNFRNYHKAWGEQLKAMGYLPIETTIVVADEE